MWIRETIGNSMCRGFACVAHERLISQEMNIVDYIF